MKQEIRVLGIDDGPADDEVLVVGTFYRGGQFMDGLLSTRVEHDGSDATARIARMITESKFFDQLQAVLLSGLSVAGFNMVDVFSLHEKTGLPVIAVVRREPDFPAYLDALRRLGRDADARWVERLGPPVAVGEVFCQFVGCESGFVEEVVSLTTTNAQVPEPLRVAHLIAGGLVSGESDGGA